MLDTARLNAKGQTAFLRLWLDVIQQLFKEVKDPPR